MRRRGLDRISYYPLRFILTQETNETNHWLSLVLFYSVLLYSTLCYAVLCCAIYCIRLDIHIVITIPVLFKLFLIHK